MDHNRRTSPTERPLSQAEVPTDRLQFVVRAVTALIFCFVFGFAAGAIEPARAAESGANVDAAWLIGSTRIPPRQAMVGMGLIMLAVSSPALALAIHAQHGAFSHATSEE